MSTWCWPIVLAMSAVRRSGLYRKDSFRSGYGPKIASHLGHLETFDVLSEIRACTVSRFVRFVQIVKALFRKRSGKMKGMG